MTESTGDYFTMTGEHYEDGVHTLTSTRTQPGRYGGDLSVSLPATAAAEREGARNDLEALLKALPIEWAGKVDTVANALAVSEWSLALANVLHGFATDIGEPSVIYLERSGDADDGPASPENIPTGPYPPARPTPAQLRLAGRKVLRSMLVSLAVGASIGAATATMARGRRR